MVDEFGHHTVAVSTLPYGQWYDKKPVTLTLKKYLSLDRAENAGDQRLLRESGPRLPLLCFALLPTFEASVLLHRLIASSKLRS